MPLLEGLQFHTAAFDITEDIALEAAKLLQQEVMHVAPEELDDKVETYFDDTHNAGTTFCVISEGSLVVAAAAVLHHSLDVRDGDFGYHTYIDLLAVDPTRFRQKLGTRLLGFVAREAADRGDGWVQLTPINDRARSFFRSYNFRPRRHHFEAAVDQLVHL